MSRQQLKILDWLLTQDATTDLPQKLRQVSPPWTFKEWHQSYRQIVESKQFHWADTADFAVIGGFHAPSAAYVFAVGYQMAVHRLIPQISFDKFYAFCVAEQQGGHPSKITTRLAPATDVAGDTTKWQLIGEKTFVTGGEKADILLVAATVGKGEDGRNQLQMVLVKQPTQGLIMSPFKLPIDLPMMQEIGHGRALLDKVIVGESDILPGDAYTTYIKPFRTAEDLHILAAFAGDLFRNGIRYQWPSEIKAQILNLVAAIRMLIISDFTHPSVHIALSGLEQQFAHLMDLIEPHWPTNEKSQQQNLQAQQQVLQGAIPARIKRLDAAWRYYSSR
ncbi:MAG TPA: hypothetical protein DCZ03_08695 [Gammaproteobacteria bacterium]|nr:hypothetical protein [Gammaproteobacteria bacterium]